MGNEAVNHFKGSFKKGGFTDKTFEEWKERKRPDRSRKIRAVLVKSGDLKRSPRVVKRTFNSITIGSKTIGDYGEVHNEGLMSGRRGARFTMPKRQFIGNSYQLNKKLRTKLNKRIILAFNV